MPAAYFLGIDAGGTHTRAVVLRDDGSVRGVGSSGPANFRTGSLRRARLSVRDAAGRALAEAGLARPAGVEALCIGAAALEEPGTEEEGRALLEDDSRGDSGAAAAGPGEAENTIRANRVILDTDVYTAWAGALECRPGILVTSGTGSIALSVDDGGHRTRVGGWGPHFGDEGSAYAIARDAIREAVKTADGRGSAVALLRALLEFAHIEPGETGETDDQRPVSRDTARALTVWLYGEKATVRRIAEFALSVDSAANAGCEEARTILAGAGRDLAALARPAASGLEPARPVPVSTGGSVLLRNRIVRESFEKALLERPGEFRPLPPAFPPAVGAAIIAMRDCGRPLDEGARRSLRQSYEQYRPRLA